MYSNLTQFMYSSLQLIKAACMVSVLYGIRHTLPPSMYVCMLDIDNEAL